MSVLLLAACGEPPPPPGTPVGSDPTPPSATPAATVALSAPAREAAVTAAEPAVAMPTGAVYACVVDIAGERRVTAIEFAPKVGALCAQHPEMGPCQYEREACRGRGGRVIAPDGKEITRATEAEYDRRVLRTKIKSS